MVPPPPLVLGHTFFAIDLVLSRGEEEQHDAKTISEPWAAM